MDDTENVCEQTENSGSKRNFRKSCLKSFRQELLKSIMKYKSSPTYYYLPVDIKSPLRVSFFSKLYGKSRSMTN